MNFLGKILYSVSTLFLNVCLWNDNFALNASIVERIASENIQGRCWILLLIFRALCRQCDAKEKASGLGQYVCHKCQYVVKLYDQLNIKHISRP